MNRSLLLLVFICLIYKANAQSDTYFETQESPKFSIGISSGINNSTGLLGALGNYRVAEKLFIQGGLGIGGWGYKSSIGLKYHKGLKTGWTYGLSFESCSGLMGIELNLESQSGTPQIIQMDLLRANTINLKTGYFWTLGKTNTFFIDLGYAFALKNKPYQTSDGSSLSSTSTAVMELLSPGGIVIGLGFMFGF